MDAIPRLVSVVVPCHNNAATIDETLCSARAQTYAPLEIVVVDDGSTDDGAERIEAHARADPRVSLVRQANQGVAAARNAGAARARGEYLAFLDADDLWSPRKLEKQVAALEAGGPETGVAYSWSSLIDERGRVIDTGKQEPVEGWMLPQMLRRNRVGNGSVALVRRSAFLAVGGFDPGCAPCDDMRFCLDLAERYRFALAPEDLTGYRLRVGSGGDDAVRMLAGFERAVAPFRERYPQYAPLIEAQHRELAQWMCSRALHGRRFEEAARILLRLGRGRPIFAAYSLLFVAVRPLLMRGRRVKAGAPRRYAEPGEPWAPDAI